jgi:hypothetical protein
MSGNPAAALVNRLPAAAARWVSDARDDIRSHPAAIDELFAVASRYCGRAPLPDDGSGPGGWTADDAVRAILLDALPLRGPGLLDVLFRLYRHGDTAERRGVLRALTVLDQRDSLGVSAVPLVEDAIRTNDSRLITAALGGYAARHLGASSYRQAVLKCVFTGIPLAEVAGIDRRADADLAVMLAGYARERLSAGRDVPPAVWPIIEAHLGPGDIPDRPSASTQRGPS